MAEIVRSRTLELGVAGLAALGMLALIITVGRYAPSQQPLSHIEPITVFPDFASIEDVDVKKQQFFDYLQDYVEAENATIAELRGQIRVFADVVNSGVGLSPRERQRVLELAEEYRIDPAEMSDQGVVNMLMRRVDEIPVSLVLAQAANESAWGTSRFTLEGYNLFGQWCYEEGCGIVPRRRSDGAFHEVEEFQSITHAVKSYFYNINTHPSYRFLRELREDMRKRDGDLDAMRLAIGLARYSERGINYVDEIQTLIQQNNLLVRDRV